MAAKKTSTNVAYRALNTPGVAATKMPGVPKVPTGTQAGGAAFSGKGPINAMPGFTDPWAGAAHGTGGFGAPASALKAVAAKLAGAGGAGAAGAAGAGAGAGGGAAALPVDPLNKYKDSTYFAQIGQNLATRGAGLTQLGEQDRRLKEDNATAMERLARNYAGQRQNITEGANKAGLFYSGILGKRLGDAEQANRDTQTDMSRTLERGLNDDQQQRDNYFKQYGNPDDPNDFGTTGATALAEGGQRYAANNPTPATVIGRPGENGLPQGFNTGGWGGLAPGYTIEWDTATGKAKRIIKL